MLTHAIQVNIVCIVSQSSQYTGLGDTDVLPTDAAETVSSPTSIPLDYQELQLVSINSPPALSEELYGKKHALVHAICH